MTVELFEVTAVIMEDEIICEDEFITQPLILLFRKGCTDGAHIGYILRLVDTSEEHVELISVEGEDPDVNY